jgi:hypothetical protein
LQSFCNHFLQSPKVWIRTCPMVHCTSIFGWRTENIMSVWDSKMTFLHMMLLLAKTQYTIYTYYQLVRLFNWSKWSAIAISIFSLFRFST